MDLFLGIDAGGTSTRALLATPTGERAGQGLAGGGNPAAHGVEAALAEITAAVRQALGDVDPRRVTDGVIGLAGLGALEDPAVHAAFGHAWAACGLRFPVRAIEDPLLAFVAGTPEPSGHVLLAGTGAGALRVENRRVTRVGDALGWLLGDEGSGFWLGRAAARAAVRQLTAGTPGELARLVAEAVAGPGADLTPRTAEIVIIRAQAAPVPTLAPLAPLVARAAQAGDPAAAGIAESAADRLLATLAGVRAPDETTPIVLAGGVLSADGPVREHVLRRCAARWAAPISVAGDTAAAAAWLAAGAEAPHTAWFPRP
ncbi:BadF/BadG/BcrA/BcrD ATPase family protein [Nonomuraea wenchangensis]